MFCHNCGSKLEEGSAFCPECGAKQFEEPENGSTWEDAAENPAEDDTAAFEKEDTPEESKRFLMIIVLIIVFGIILGVGGFFLYQKLSSPKPEKAQATEEKDTKEESSSKKDTARDENPDSKESETEKADTEKADADDKANTAQEDTPKEITYTHTYALVREMRTWEDAKTYCEAQGGHLATITSPEEYAEIIGTADASGCVVIWIGGQRLQDDSFGWITNEDFSFNAWAAGEPNNDGGAENYLGLMKVNGEWGMYDMPNDVSPYYSSSKVGFILEKDIPE